MQFRNLTPFSALCYAAIDKEDQEYRLVVMKVGYQLKQDEQSQWYAQVIDDKSIPLCMADEYWEGIGTSSVRYESDLAPHKPYCDVIVNGSAYAPQGKPASEWVAGIRISSATATETLKQGEVLLDKRLKISGPSFFFRDSMQGWQRTRAAAVTQVKLRWENTFGGYSKILDPQKPEAPPLLNEVCFSNPLGKGWIEQRWYEISQKIKSPIPDRIPAPQVEYTQDTTNTPVFVKHPQQNLDAKAMSAIAQGYGKIPAGFGIVGRAWTPRLQLAGTYDEEWLENRHPYLPQDFDFRYWNAAPIDQQIPYPPSDIRIELGNLTNPEKTPKGYLAVTLPAHRAFILMRLHTGLILVSQMQVDTLIIDSDNFTISLAYRVKLPLDKSLLRIVEARFEINPDAPLIRFTTQEVEQHG